MGDCVRPGSLGRRRRLGGEGLISADRSCYQTLPAWFLRLVELPVEVDQVVLIKTPCERLEAGGMCWGSV